MSASKPHRKRIDVGRTMRNLADRVAEDPFGPLPPYVRKTLQFVIEELKLRIPGLQSTPNQSAADELLERAQRAAANGRFRDSLSLTVRGLAASAFDARLWRQLGNLCWELDDANFALQLLEFALWINPGYEGARSDMIGIVTWLGREQQEEEDEGRG